jgi:hypothetical protein
MHGLGFVIVQRGKLLERLGENREKHRAIFESALEGYRSRAIVELDAMLEDAKAGRQIRRMVSLIEPEDHTEDYDRVIDMLEMSVNDEIEISAQEFAQYVRDDWAWKRAFYASTVGAGYIGDNGEFPGPR